MVNTVFKMLLLQVLLMQYSGYLHGQTSLELPVNIWQAIQDGNASIEHSPLDIGIIGQVFDGDDVSLARSAAINPMVITLEFQNIINVSHTDLLTSHGSSGWWTLEIADNLADLNAQTGSYSLLVFQSAQFSDVPANYEDDFTARVIRLQVKRTIGDDYVHLNEWSLTATQTVEATGLCLLPNALRLVPGASFQMKAAVTDVMDNQYLLPFDLDWSTSDPDLFSVGPNGWVTAGPDTGTSVLRVQLQDLTQTISVSVVPEFVVATADPRVVKVALVIIDPAIPAVGGLRFSEHFWPFNGGPAFLAQSMADSLTAVSGGVVQYQIAQSFDSDSLFCTFGEVSLTADSIYQLFLEPDWATLHYVAEQLGESRFDYNGMLEYYDFCAMSDAGLVDEIWVYSMPFLGTWESTLTGEGAFWYNSPPLSGNDCVGHLPIMGLNYERGLGEALHSFGHRTESAMAQVFGRWSYNAQVLNSWEVFTSYDLIFPEEAQVGNVHFPPNGTSDYDYVNQQLVPSHAVNWKRYPFLFQESETLNCATWNCDQLGYLLWWYRHIPHFKCKDQFNHLNNWWIYIVDYNEGKALEAATPGCDCKMFEDDISGEHTLNREMIARVSPNPVVDKLTIQISSTEIGGFSASLYNAYGVLMFEKKQAVSGTDKLELNLTGFPNGPYFLHIFLDGGVNSVLPVLKIDSE